MSKSNSEKEIDDIVSPIPQSKPNYWLIATVSLSTVAVVFAIAFALGFFNSKTQTSTQDCIQASDTKNYIGKNISVCGKVVSATYASRTKGKPTFINLDKPYPNQVFSIVVWGDDRSKFGTPENDFRDKTIRVTGKVELFRGTPEIVVTDPSQVVIQQ